MDKISKYNVDELDNGNLLVSGQSINNKEVAAPTGDYLKINGAWYLDALPNQIVAELEDGSLTKFRLTPFRQITEKDFTPYKSYHPRKCKGQPLPEYLYRFYGLERNEEGLTEVIRVRLSPSEKEKLDSISKNDNKNVSEFIRDYVRSL